MATDRGIALVDLDEDGVDRAFRADVLKGLRQRQKAVPARWFYDEEGSRLFERITKLDEYYPTRAEREILEARSDDLAKPGHPLSRAAAWRCDSRLWRRQTLSADRVYPFRLC